MEDKEHQPGAGVSENSDSTAVEPAVITNDPDAPVLSHVTEEDVTTPAAPDESDEGNSGSDGEEDRSASGDVAENAPAVITNDPDAPVLSDVSDEDVTTPAAPDDSDESNSASDSVEESLASADVAENAPSVITNDADEEIATPTSPDDSDESNSGPDSDEESSAPADVAENATVVITNDADEDIATPTTPDDSDESNSGPDSDEESSAPADVEENAPAVITNDTDENVATPDTPDDPDGSNSVPDTDAGGEEGLDSPEPTPDTVLVVATADPDENGAPSIEPETAPVLTADPDESLFPPGGSDEVSPDQFLVGVEQPKKDDEIARRLAVLEAIIYVTDEPLSAEQIAKAMGEPFADVKLLLDQLVAEYNRAEHGLTVKEVAGGYKMATKPEHHEAVRTFVKNLNPPLKLSLAALETLAVIAYKQPITAPEIMEVRGVQGAGVLKTLIDRKLITTAGRKNVVGKPILYKTTKEFLVQFGLRDLAELPTLKEFEDLRRMAFSDADDVLGAAEAAPPATPEASEESEE